jgi:hypothetical protein
MNIRPDVVEAVRNPTFTIRRNRSAAGHWRHTDAQGRVVAAGTFEPRRPLEPTVEVQITRRSGPVLLEVVRS